jgi:hypothetical protein
MVDSITSHKSIYLAEFKLLLIYTSDSIPVYVINPKTYNSLSSSLYSPWSDGDVGIHVLCNMYKLIIILDLVIIWGNQFNYNKLTCKYTPQQQIYTIQKGWRLEKATKPLRYLLRSGLRHPQRSCLLYKNKTKTKLIIILDLVIIWGNQFNYNKLINTNSYFKKYTFNIFIGLRVTYLYLYSFVLALFSTQYYIYFVILFLFCFCKANNFSDHHLIMGYINNVIKIKYDCCSKIWTYVFVVLKFEPLDKITQIIFLALFSTQYYIYFVILFLFCFCKANNFSGDGVSHFSTSSAVALWPFLVASPFV